MATGMPELPVSAGICVGLLAVAQPLTLLSLLVAVVLFSAGSGGHRPRAAAAALAAVGGGGVPGRHGGRAGAPQRLDRDGRADRGAGAHRSARSRSASCGPELGDVDALMGGTVVWAAVAGLVIALDLLLVALVDACSATRLNQRDITLILLLVAVTVYAPMRGWSSAAGPPRPGRPARGPVRRRRRPRRPAGGAVRRPRAAACPGDRGAAAFKLDFVRVEVIGHAGGTISATHGDPAGRDPRGADPVRRGARSGGSSCPRAGPAVDAVQAGPGAAVRHRPAGRDGGAQRAAGRRPPAVPRAARAGPRGGPAPDPAGPARRARARCSAASRCGSTRPATPWTPTPRRPAGWSPSRGRTSPTRWPTYAGWCTGCARPPSTTSACSPRCDQQAERTRAPADLRSRWPPRTCRRCPRRSRSRRTGSRPRRSTNTARHAGAHGTARPAARQLARAAGRDRRRRRRHRSRRRGRRRATVDPRARRGARWPYRDRLPTRRRHPGAGLAADDHRRRGDGPMTDAVRVLIADDHPVFRDGLPPCSPPSPASRWWRPPPTAREAVALRRRAPAGRRRDGPADAGHERHRRHPPDRRGAARGPGPGASRWGRRTAPCSPRCGRAPAATW